MKDFLGIVLIVVVVIYSFIGMKAVRYIKREMFHVSVEFFSNAVDFWWKEYLKGFVFGWLAIPIALIHWLIVGRNH